MPRKKDKFRNPITVIIEPINQKLSFADFVDMVVDFDEKPLDEGVNKGPSESKGDSMSGE